MMDQKVGKKQIIIAGAFAALILPIVGLTVFLFTKPQNSATKASSTTTATAPNNTTSTTASSNSAPAQSVCTPPGQVTNVTVNYPNCQ